MATKTYRCEDFPQLTIAGVCKFVNNEFTTNSLVIQSKIEMSQSFHAGIVRTVEVDDEEPSPLNDIEPKDLTRMKKAQLVELALEMGVEHGDDATRQDLISMCADELRRNEG